MQELSQKDVYKAVSQYLRELGIDRNYVENMLRQKIDARNPEDLVRQAVSKYFRRGSDGYDAAQIVLDKTRQVINETVRTAMRNGVQEQLDAVINEHVAQITGQLRKQPAQTNKIRKIRKVRMVKCRRYGAPC